MNTVALSPHAGAQVRKILNRSMAPAHLRNDFRYELRQRLLADAERLSGRRRPLRIHLFGRAILLTRERQATLGLLLSLLTALAGAILYYRVCSQE